MFPWLGDQSIHAVGLEKMRLRVAQVVLDRKLPLWSQLLEELLIDRANGTPQGSGIGQLHQLRRHRLFWLAHGVCSGGKRPRRRSPARPAAKPDAAGGDQLDVSVFSLLCSPGLRNSSIFMSRAATFGSDQRER